MAHRRFCTNSILHLCVRCAAKQALMLANVLTSWHKSNYISLFCLVQDWTLPYPTSVKIQHQRCLQPILTNLQIQLTNLVGTKYHKLEIPLFRKYFSYTEIQDLKICQKCNSRMSELQIMQIRTIGNCKIVHWQTIYIYTYPISGIFYSYIGMIFRRNILLMTMVKFMFPIWLSLWFSFSLWSDFGSWRSSYFHFHFHFCFGSQVGRQVGLLRLLFSLLIWDGSR